MNNYFKKKYLQYVEKRKKISLIDDFLLLIELKKSLDLYMNYSEVFKKMKDYFEHKYSEKEFQYPYLHEDIKMFFSLFEEIKIGEHHFINKNIITYEHLGLSYLKIFENKKIKLLVQYDNHQIFLLKRNKLHVQSIDFNTYVLKNMLLCLISHHNMNNFINIIQDIEMIPYIEKLS